MDIIIILLLTLINIPVVEFTQGIPRVILGVIVLLLFPGYTLMLGLFPRKNSLRGIERAGLTLISSFALVVLTGLALNYSPWGIKVTPLVIIISVLIILLTGISFLRRRKLPESERFALRFSLRKPEWRRGSRLDTALYIALAVVVVVSLSTLSYVIARPKFDEAYTNFYMLNPNGLMESYPRTITPGQEALVTLGIENHENDPVNYRVSVMLNGEEIQSIGPISLDDEGKWSSQVIIIPSQAGENQQVEFRLYKDESAEPYLKLRLWLDVKEN